MSLQIIDGPIINAGESLSSEVDLTAGTLVRLTMPADWDPQSNLSFQISSGGGGFNDMFGVDGEEIVIEVVAGTGVVLPANFMRGVAFVKFRSGTRDNPVPQTETRLFSVAIEVPDIAPPARAGGRARE